MVVFSILISLVLILFPTILHRVYRAPRIKEQATPATFGLPYIEQAISTVNDKRLFAWYIPATNSRVTLVIAHGWGGNAEMMIPLVDPFHKAGFDVLLYDARNHGKSDCDSFSSLPRFAEDLTSALVWVEQKYPHHKIVVLGHSIGAAASILSASTASNINLLISLSSFAHPDLVMKRHLEQPWLPRLLVPVIMNYIQWVIGFRFDDIAPMNRISDVECPVLLVHGSKDRVVPISDMHLIAANAPKDKIIETISVNGAQHDSVERFHDHANVLLKFVRDNL
jgi:alpha-beta hydrolase superfamily lysophospholipase